MPATAPTSYTSVQWGESYPRELEERRLSGREGLQSTGILSLGLFGCSLVDTSVATPPDPVVVLLARRTALLGAFSRRPPVFLLSCCGVISGQ
jgi:hypothetical protein